jgi:3-oxoacyl-[acyl-carrier-protein] synthase II
MRDAKVNADVVDFISAHGTSTPLGDIAETKAMKKTFGGHAGKLAISSIKSMLGHLLGAAGGVAAVSTALSVHHNLVTPTINLDNQDPECDLDYVPNRSRDMKVNYAMVNSFGFGGHNASILLKKI